MNNTETRIELDAKLEIAKLIKNPEKRANKIQQITNEFFDFTVGTLGDGDGVDADFIDENNPDTMVAQGNNKAWNDAIILAEINATNEGIDRAKNVKIERNREYTKNRTKIVRAKKKPETEARKELKKTMRENRNKYARREKISLPSQKA